jgi:hypothetical protein
MTMRLLLCTLAALFLSAGVVRADPKTVSFHNLSSKDTVFLVVRGEGKAEQITVPKGQNITVPMAKDKSDRVFVAYETGGSGQVISDPAVVRAVAYQKLTGIPGDELGVILDDGGIFFWSFGNATYSPLANQKFPKDFSEEKTVKAMLEARKKAKQVSNKEL